MQRPKEEHQHSSEMATPNGRDAPKGAYRSSADAIDSESAGTRPSLYCEGRCVSGLRICRQNPPNNPYLNDDRSQYIQRLDASQKNGAVRRNAPRLISRPTFGLILYAAVGSIALRDGRKTAGKKVIACEVKRVVKLAPTMS